MVLKRTPREWTETCNKCDGQGNVKRRQHFALWTPDEFEHVRPLDPLDAEHNVPADAYVCTAAPGSTIFEACKEAKDIAITLGRPVAFEFNGKVAVVYADSDPIAVTKEWWLRVYGQTYEQSMAER